jgi:hypothetical protein
MQILAHRGIWNDPLEQNSLVAFRRAFDGGFGIETDLRDHAGRLVTHDPPMGGELAFDDLVATWVAHGQGRCLALNIKADGLQSLLRTSLNPLAQSDVDYFLFDMSVPDAMSSLANGFPTFTRLSDEERSAAFADRASGVWVDGFRADWADLPALETYLRSGKRACIVSPELHRRSPDALWARIAEWQ